MATTKKHAPQRAARKPAQKSKATTKAKPTIKAKPTVKRLKPLPAPSVIVPPVVAVTNVGTPQAQVVVAAPGTPVPPTFDPDDANVIGPGLRERAAECRKLGEKLTPSPGFHFFIVKGVLDQEADPPAAPPAKPEASLSAQLKDAKAAAPAAGEHRWVKTNLVTISKGGSMYDTARCSVCGATAKRYGVGGHTLDKGMPARCPGAKPQPKPAAAPAPTNGGATRQPPPIPASWGKPGSQAEAYKRLLMTTDLDEEAIHKAVEKELGKGKGGPLSYVAWYRSRLRRDGFSPTGGADRG